MKRPSSFTRLASFTKPASFTALGLGLAVLATPAAAQVADDSAFRLQQERSRLDAARETARIEQDRLKLSPEPPRGLRSDPARDIDRLSRENRLRDQSRQLDSDSDRLRAEQQRIERERLFAPAP